MPDERQDSIRQGIQAPDESIEGQRAAELRRRSAATGPEIGGAMGGTSDSDSAGDEAHANAAQAAAAAREADEAKRAKPLPQKTRPASGTRKDVDDPRGI
jgi:hypothetical protein